MRKEYSPAMVVYAISFGFCVAAAICFFTKDINWATWLVIGIGLLVFASSLLTKAGKKLREDEEREKSNEDNNKE